ncbi:NAD(P)H-hydrate dehydratase [Jeotgalibacillus soli]|uniref:ADP-dependent (S)-NAD(P)H-hydrate dehydratase n=1 Tax=Jeotgalibacillus soli TaxID=889306 RepID=A0A0C2RNL0_9BACL|nr:NAD(P)H-hydrate dehydratase [Jeotgalibacillus soli]KIL51865.1 carbohydrate kinase-like protein YxkO [Jeotgalibacillus soli]
MKQQRASFWTREQVNATLSIRGKDSHKGTFGTGLLLAGSEDMPGAALLAGLGAMRSGIGKLVIGTPDGVIPLIVPALPEATYWRNGLEKARKGRLEERYQAIAIGPGIASTPDLEQVITRVFEMDCPVVLDAGALSERTYPKRKQPIILTPHPGEFSRITGIPLEELQKNREELTKEWAQRLGVTIVLKGKETVVAFPDGDCRVNPTGNESLAKGGTGDTLTGMILGMICCHDYFKPAVLNAVYLHGACADKWTETNSPHTLLAHELTHLLPAIWKQLER